MNLKTTYVLFAVLAAALVGLALTQIFGSRGGSQSDYVFAELHAKKSAVKDDEIDSVRIDHGDGGTTIAFKRDDKKSWVMEEPQGFRVDRFAVDNLVRDVIGAQKEKVDVVKDPKEYELDHPRVTVTISKGEQSWELKVGKQDQGNDPHVFVTASTRPKEPVAVKKSRLAGVFKSVNDFRARELVAANTNEAQSVELQGHGQKEPIILEKDTGGRWAFKKPAGFGEADYEGEGPPPLATEARKITGVLGLLQAVTGLRVEGEGDFIADNVSAQELKDKYGLDGSDPATLRVEIKASKMIPNETEKTTTTETLLIGKKVPEDKEAKKDDKKDEKKDEKKGDKDKKPDERAEYYYARLGNENNIVKVPLKKVDSLVQLAGEPDTLRDRTLAQFDRDKIDAIQIENSEGTFRLFKADAIEPWKLWREKTGVTAEASTVQGLLDALDPKKEGKRRVDNFPAKKPEEVGMDKNARLAVVSLWSEGVKKQEKKDAEPELKDPKAPPTVRLTVGKREKDRGLVYVLRELAGDKAPQLLLVKDKETGKEGLVDRVTPGPLAYIDRKFPSFTPGEGVEFKQLSLTRGGETFLLKHEKTGDTETWKFEAPKDSAGRLADRHAVEDLLFFGLQRIMPLRVVAEKPNDKQLEGFGLKPPQFEATVTLTDKDKKEDKYTYQFGKETPDKSGIFAKSSRSDLVYVIPSAVLNSLQAELQDKAVFAFDVEKVRSLKLSGWLNVSGVLQMLNLERKSKQSWIAKEPQGYEPEPTTTENFVLSLSSLRAIKFLQGGVKPEYGLDPKTNKSLLLIEIIVDGEKEPLKLTIGAANTQDKAYYATSSNLKGQVFLVPEDTFKRVLEKMGYFSKQG
jgi:hypothetical protein